MCGFAGFLAADNTIVDAEASSTLRRMADAIIHRGPDGDGYWIDLAEGIGLAHRRLSIVDLSSAGAQPMTSVSGRYVIVFNGEIYNHMRLRHALQREGQTVAPWRGHSDTETLLAGFDAWGIENTLCRTVGMFALAVWDRERRTVTMARDRLGEKPLYYGWQGQGAKAVFLFGSDLLALRQHPAFNAQISRSALALYMRHSCIGGTHSIYTGIHKLLPGHLLTLSVVAPEPQVRVWWSAAEIAERGVAEPFRGSPDDATDTLAELLHDAVGQQMVADVPLGAFLSGGIDSSTVVALMQTQSSRRVKTFSIGFYESGYNEAEHAQAVARHLGTDHTELYVTPDQAMAVIPQLPHLYSEPFADSSQIPTFLVSQLAREHVAVSLSGDAGDELFCGYPRYQIAAGTWSKISLFPQTLRRTIADSITAVSSHTWNKLGTAFSKPRMGDKLHRRADLLRSHSLTELYRGLVSYWPYPNNVLLGAVEPDSALTGMVPGLCGLNNVERLMALDMLSYLPDDILAKVDRAAMGVSLETRAPFLDHRVVEFVWSLPLDYKLHGSVTKWSLRQILYRHVPRELIERPKMGFSIPVGDWLRGPLRDWAENLLSEERVRREGFFYPAPIREKWNEHLSGRHNWENLLWCVLMFQAWLEHQKA